jgi:hypothetical protein
MNPILKEAIDEIKKRMPLTDEQASVIAFEIGQAMIQVSHGCITNPNFNMKGGEYADENSYVPRSACFGDTFKNCTAFDQDITAWETGLPDAKK